MVLIAIPLDLVRYSLGFPSGYIQQKEIGISLASLEKQSCLAGKDIKSKSSQPGAASLAAGLLAQHAVVSMGRTGETAVSSLVPSELDLSRASEVERTCKVEFLAAALKALSGGLGVHLFSVPLLGLIERMTSPLFLEEPVLDPALADFEASFCSGLRVQVVQD